MATKQTKATATTTTASKGTLPGRDSAAFYDPFIAAWQADKCGPVVTPALIATVVALKQRPGIEMLHIAMCLRAGGCTVDEYRWAGRNLTTGMPCGPANNNRKAFIVAGLLNESITREGRSYRFKCTLTAKAAAIVAAHGVKVPKAALPADAKAAPKAAKATRKPRQPKAAPPVTAPQADQPAPQA